MAPVVPALAVGFFRNRPPFCCMAGAVAGPSPWASSSSSAGAELERLRHSPAGKFVRAPRPPMRMAASSYTRAASSSDVKYPKKRCLPLS